MERQRRRFQLVFSLALKQKWLGLLESELFSLFDECDSEEEIELVSDLLHRFKFLDSEEERAAQGEIVNAILALDLAEDLVQVVATSADDEADSGQAVLYALKPLFERRGWSQVKMVNQFAKAQRYVPERPVVCFVDEFVGTGRTLIGRAQTLVRDFKANKGFEAGRFFAFAYAGMESAKEVLQASGLFEGVFLVHSLRRGISDSYHGSDGAEKKAFMQSLEGKLQSMVDSYILPSFGDGACEALYGREGGNAPNSVFPIFWWPKRYDGERRRTLLVRKL